MLILSLTNFLFILTIFNLPRAVVAILDSFHFKVTEEHQDNEPPAEHGQCMSSIFASTRAHYLRGSISVI